MVDVVKNLTINDAKYYESNKNTVSDSQGDLTRNQETITYTSNMNEAVTHTTNGNCEHKLLSNRTIPLVVPTMNLRLYQSIKPIVLTPQTLLTPAKKEGIMDTALGSAWVNRNPGQVSRTGVNQSTPCNIFHAVRVIEPLSIVLIRIVAIYPPCILNMSQKVANKRPRLGRAHPKIGRCR